ncbi:GNAT family N-acetyltransferase [Candidatus Bipolaricaulota bacterium]
MLTGHHVVLRTVREADLDGLYDLIADVRAIGDYWPLRIGSESEWLKRFHENGWWTEDFGRLLLTNREGKRLGYVNYYRPSHSYQGLEIGYRIFRPDDRGQGYMGEAVPLFVSYLFEVKEIERIQALVNPANQGSSRVLERSGFVYEGTLRRCHYDRGTYNDLRMYSILRADAPPLSSLLAPSGNAQSSKS